MAWTYQKKKIPESTEPLQLQTVYFNLKLEALK
jgi:hypothetical protein